MPGLPQRGERLGPPVVGERGAIDASAVRSVVLDEADQMLDLGFREELEAILEKLPEARRTHLVSATFSREVLSLAANYQEDAVLVEGTGLGKANVDISYSAHLVRPHDRQDALVNLLLMRPDERCLIFVRTRAEASELAERLGAAGFRALPISGELEQRERNKTLEAFRNGMIKILVATDVAARGIDVPAIQHIINFDLPESVEDYIHRAGRTARGAARGTVSSIATWQDKTLIREIESKLDPECKRLLDEWPATKKRYAAAKYQYQVRDKVIEIDLTSETLSQVTNFLMHLFVIGPAIAISLRRWA